MEANPTVGNQDAVQRYRTYITKWRDGENAATAYKCLERAIEREYQKLNLLSATKVQSFIRDYREIDIYRVVEDQHSALVDANDFEYYHDYFEHATKDDKYYEEIKARIDEIVERDIASAVEHKDIARMRSLSTRYMDWGNAFYRLQKHIAKATDDLAAREWQKLASSRSESDLKRFAARYSTTKYAENAKKRIDDLYADFDFVSAKGTLRAYYDFAKKHPDSPRVSEAKKCIVDILEDYVFKRKKIPSGEESFVQSVLREQKQFRPPSGILVNNSYTRNKSPLQIITSSYSSGDYYVKLVNKSNGNIVGIYVRSGATIEVDIPDGTYSIRYATGNEWYGTRLLFGMGSHYSKVNNQVFNFRDGSGYSLTLYQVQNGNMRTSTISADEF